jgi:flagellar biosynthesis/type III secretory pathway chaperone
MEADQIARELGELIAQETHCAQRLLRRLETEQEPITRRDTDALAKIISEKEHDLTELQTLGAACARLLQTTGRSPDRSGFDDCLRACDPDGELHARAQKRDRVLGQCQRLNRINGGVLELTRRGVEQALALLHDRATDDNTYGPAGRPVGQIGSRSLAKA